MQCKIIYIFLRNSWKRYVSFSWQWHSDFVTVKHCITRNDLHEAVRVPSSFAPKFKHLVSELIEYVDGHLQSAMLLSNELPPNGTVS